MKDTMNQNLANFIKYCLGYINITRQKGFFSQQKSSIEISENILNLEGLLNGELDEKTEELINLETFYSYDPKKVPEELKEEYQKQKELANKIEDIYNKHRNDQYRKQIILHFGHFEIEIPQIEEENGDVTESVELSEEKAGKQAKLFEGKEFENEKEDNEVNIKKESYPLFSLPIRIEKDCGKYFMYTVDPEIQVNIGSLEGVLGEELYFQLLEKISKYEIDDRFTIPINDLAILQEVWHEVKNQLKLRDVVFEEESFSLEEMKLTLGLKANYFLSEDLRKLSELSGDLEKSSLISWVNNDGLNEETKTIKKTELYFPFAYDKHQVRILSLLKNKAFIVEGPPGTGKSQTISNLLCHLAASGKKVLFVSQKAQALKVVKDKLKTLGVDYLFGYLPNPASAQLNEIDELDGIAPQLSAMNQHIEKILHGSQRSNANKSSELSEAVEKTYQLVNDLNLAVETQRKAYALYAELEKLKEFEMSITEFDVFCQCFSREYWRGIKDLKGKMEELSHFLEKYGNSKEKRQLDKVFSKLDFNGTKYFGFIDTILGDVEKTCYDKHSKFFRNINNTKRNFRLKTVRNSLPMEIIDVVDELLLEDLSKNEKVKFLKMLSGYCQFFEVKSELEEHRLQLEKSLCECGVSHDEFQIIDKKILETPSCELEKIKDKIVRAQAIKEELKNLKAGNQNVITSQLHDIRNDVGLRVAHYLKNILNKNIIEKCSTSITVRQIVRRLASAFKKSKTAFKTFDKIRKDADNFNTILDLIPIWIMELDDASRIVPLEAGIFDYVILDEASQCNVAYTLPVMFRAKHAIFVGDSEQMRDNTIMFKSNRTFDELAKRHQIPDELRIKSTGTTVQSVLDIAYLRGFQNKALTYHYRSPKELIGFCNKYFYIPKGKELISLNSQYLTYKDTNRIMIAHYIENDWSEEFSDAVNVAEAKAILSLFRELRSDDKYKNKSIGILSFFNAQATFIRELLEKEGFKEEKNDYVVSIIDGIQGDEKDIIIYSFVIRAPQQKRMYIPLTGEGGDVQRDINMGRVNVAFSRARLQVHCFSSLPVDKIPEGIWIKKFLKYIEENGGIDFYSTEMKPFDSYFEEEFYHFIRTKLGKNYITQNQIESCGFKLDFVISNKKNGKKIAIECDGPTHFEDELDEECSIYVESDQERQRVLEAAGWNFYRLKYSDWLDERFDRDGVYVDVKKLLQ